MIFERLQRLDINLKNQKKVNQWHLVKRRASLQVAPATVAIPVDLPVVAGEDLLAIPLIVPAVVTAESECK